MSVLSLFKVVCLMRTRLVRSVLDGAVIVPESFEVCILEIEARAANNRPIIRLCLFNLDLF
jgi:hypothetical protein